MGQRRRPFRTSRGANPIPPPLASRTARILRVRRGRVPLAGWLAGWLAGCMLPGQRVFLAVALVRRGDEAKISKRAGQTGPEPSKGKTRRTEPANNSRPKGGRGRGGTTIHKLDQPERLSLTRLYRPVCIQGEVCIQSAHTERQVCIEADIQTDLTSLFETTNLYTCHWIVANSNSARILD